MPERVPTHGILIPEAFKDSMMRGDTKVFRILAVGSKCPDVEPGDIAICYSHTDGPQPLGNGHMVITHDQIIAVVPTNQSA